MEKTVSEPIQEIREEIDILTGRILSLKSTEPCHEQGKLYMKLYRLLVQAHRVDDAEKSLYDAISNFEGAGVSEVLSEYSTAVYMLGILFHNKGRYLEAEQYLEKAYDLCIKAVEIEKACSVLNSIGINLESKGEIKNALLTYRRGLTTARQNRYHLLQMKFIYNTSVLFSRYPSLHKEALKYNEEAVYLCRKIDNFRGLGYVLTNTAFLLHRAGSTDQAVKNAREAYVVREKHGTYYEKGFACLNLAGYLDINEEQEEKEDLYLRARKILHETRYFSREIECLLGLVQIELRRNDLEKARDYLASAWEIVSGIESNESIRVKLLETEYDLEKACGNWEAALCALERMEGTSKLLNKDKTSKELKTVCAKWDVDLINMENTLLQARNRELEDLNDKLVRSLEQIRQLSGLLPICTRCGKVKDDEGYWQQLDDYVSSHYNNRISHSLCDECRAILYPRIQDENEGQQ